MRGVPPKTFMDCALVPRRWCRDRECPASAGVDELTGSWLRFDRVRSS